MSDGIDISLDKTADSDDGGSSRGGNSGGGGVRGTITVSERYGTTVYGPETACDRCGKRAVGVLVIPDGIVSDDYVGHSAAMCGSHRDDAKESYSSAWEKCEFRRFVDA